MELVPITDPYAFDEGFWASLDPLSAPPGSYALGSRNSVFEGIGKGARPWRGLLSKGANTGSRIMSTVGSSWGGIKDIGVTLGSGSLFQDVGRSLWGIGAGQVSLQGVDVAGFTLSSILQVCLSVGGSYVHVDSGPYSAGLAQPSSPDVGIVAVSGGGLTGTITGPVSVKIARLRNKTGARSIASTTSAVIVLVQGQTVRVTFPTAATGQDYWAVFFTQQGFGGVGLHYRLACQGSLDISEATVAASSVDGVSRSLEFDYKDGDLVPELAYIDDYVPPAGTHAVRLENVMAVLGCYPDSVSAPTSTNTGTCGAISLPNFYESFKPRNLVYFPEPVVGVLARPSDSYAYVLCRNSILTLQYVGLQDGPACAVTVAIPDVGVANQHNACQAFGRIFLWVENGGLVGMNADGSIDYNFASPVKEFTKNWDNTTVVGFNPATLSIVASNGSESVSFCLQNGKWSTPHYFTDAGVAGSALSCATSRGQLLVTVNNAGSHTAYDYDRGAASMLVTSMSSVRGMGGRTRNLMELDVGVETDNTNPVIISMHRNLRKSYVTDAVTANASNVVTSASAKFDANHTNDMVCVFGTNVGGPGVNHLRARIQYVSPTTIHLFDPVTGATLDAGATLAGRFMLIAHTISSYTPIEGQQFLSGLRDMYVPEAFSLQIGVTLQTSATKGQVNQVLAFGTGSGMTSRQVA